MAKILVEGDSHRDGVSPVSRRTSSRSRSAISFPVPKSRCDPGHVEPRFVDAERLNLIGAALVDGVDPPGILGISVPVGSHQLESGAFALGLPDCFGGLHTVFLCRLILGEDDAVPAFGVSADRPSARRKGWGRAPSRPTRRSCCSHNAESPGRWRPPPL